MTSGCQVFPDYSPLILLQFMQLRLFYSCTVQQLIGSKFANDPFSMFGHRTVKTRVYQVQSRVSDRLSSLNQQKQTKKVFLCDLTFSDSCHFFPSNFAIGLCKSIIRNDIFWFHSSFPANLPQNPLSLSRYPNILCFCPFSCWMDSLFFVSLLVVCSVIAHAPVPVQSLLEEFFRIQQNSICSWIS